MQFSSHSRFFGTRLNFSPRSSIRAAAAFLFALALEPAFAYPNLEGEKSEDAFSRAVSETVISNIIVWGFDYTVLQAGYARIGLDSWSRNLQEGFQWDKSMFFTNQVLHPYQGSMYFNAARTNGFSFWESAPFAVSGSLMWEVFMEREKPSANDLITTSLGGIALGEGGYRLALAVIDEDDKGLKRAFKEFIAALLNPVLSVNRMIYGTDRKSLKKMKKVPYELSILSGVNRTRDDLPLFDASPHPFFGFNLDYGEPYDMGEIHAPYDYFSFHADVELDVANPTWDIFGQAVLYGRQLYLGRNARGLLGFFQHFDYLENFVYKFAANGLGAGAQAYVRLNDELSLEVLLHLAGIALGGLDSRYSRSVDGREYSLGPGAAVKAGLIVKDETFGLVSVLYNRYWFTTVSGSDRHNIVGIFALSAEYYLKKDLRLGLGFNVYDRWSNADMDSSSTYGVRTYLAHDL